MSCLNGASGITLSSWFLEQNPPPLSYTPCHPTSKMSSINSLMRISTLAASVHLSLPWRPSILYQEERWQSPLCSRLSQAQCDDNKEHVPAPVDPRFYEQGFKGQILYQARCSLGIQQCADQGG